jgi:hypothetical protein
MKAGQLHAVLEAAARMHREVGNPTTADALEEICTLFDGRKTMAVPAFAALIDQVVASETKFFSRIQHFG